MADLPEARVTSARSFSSVGVDYTGPFLYKEGNSRKPTICKGYVAVYVCTAVFLDLVCDFTTDAFLASLRRFSSIYGVPARIFSDNGSNFIGAYSYLVQLKNLLQLSNHHFSKDCQWSRVPHFGGLWEAAVKRLCFSRLLEIKLCGTMNFFHFSEALQF